jgi:MSHA pilin protein MshC
MNPNLVGSLLQAAPRHQARVAVRTRARGFTLIELVMVMVMLGVLAVFAAPRVFNRNDFEARGFHDQTLGLLRFAQKTAIAQRRAVCVVFTANSLTLTIAATDISVTCENPLNGPTGEAALNAPTNVTYTATPGDFHFDGLGQPLTLSNLPVPRTITNAPAPRTINVVNAGRTITVEAATGYVHD